GVESSGRLKHVRTRDPTSQRAKELWQAPGAKGHEPDHRARADFCPAGPQWRGKDDRDSLAARTDQPRWWLHRRPGTRPAARATRRESRGWFSGRRPANVRLDD